MHPLTQGGIHQAETSALVFPVKKKKSMVNLTWNTKKWMSFRIRVRKGSCMRPIVSGSSWKALYQAQLPNPRLRLTLLCQPGPVNVARERGLQSRPGSTYVSSPLPAHAPAFLFYTNSFFPSLIVCLPTVPGLLKQNAGIFFSSPFTKPQFSLLYWSYIKLVNWMARQVCPHLPLVLLYACLVDQIAAHY